jgi:hypothetical protein
MESLSFKTIFATVRPPRIAVLVPSDDPHWQNTCLRVLEFFSQLWGGHYNIVVPTDGRSLDSQSWAFLDAFSPDYIYEYQPTGRDVKINEPKKFENWLETQTKEAHVIDRALIEEALEKMPFSSKVSAELACAVKDRLIPFHFGENVVGTVNYGAEPHFPLTGTLDLQDLFSQAGQPSTMEFFRGVENKAANLWLASAFGALSVEYQDALTKANVLLSATEVSESNLRRLVVETAEWDHISRTVPFSLCRTNVSFYRSIMFSAYQEPALVVLGDTLQDFSFYQCLSRLRGGVVWLPLCLVEGTGYPAQLANILMHLRTRAESRRVSLCSMSLSKDELKQVLARIPSGFDVDVGYSPNPALQHSRFLLAQQLSPKPIAGQFLGNALVGFVETPKPIGFSHPTKHRWITNIEISSYLPPRHPDLATHMLAVRGDTSNARTTRQGWSYCCPHEGTYFGGALDEVLTRPSLRILEVPEILQRLGLGCGLRFSPSEKGAYAEDSISKFGSLEGAANFLRDQTSRRVLDKFLSSKKATFGVLDEGVYTQGRRYFDLTAFEKLLGSRSVAAALVDDLLDKRVLHRGFIFQCKSCRNADWYGIAKVTEAFECSRCGKSQPYRRENWRQPEEPAWYYKLDEIVYQGYKHGMIAPVLTNDYLRRNSSSFQFAAEQQVFENHASEPFMEIDVCAVAEGKLLIGEAKTASFLENNAKERRKIIDKYRDLAQKLRVHGVVFSTTTDEWAPGTLADLRQAFADSRIELIMLTGKELLQ